MPNSPAPTSLQDLIDMALERHRVKWMTDLARIAKAAKPPHVIVSTTLKHMQAGTYSSKPSRKTIAALAYLAGVEYEVAAKAALGGVEVTRPFTERVPVEVDQLPGEDQEFLLEVCRWVVRVRRSVGDQPAGEDVSYLVEDNRDVAARTGEDDADGTTGHSA